MNKVDIDALRRAAEAATDGEWFTEIGGIYNTTRSYMVTPTGDSPQDRDDAEFIAAANPTVVLELLTTIDKQRLALSRGWNLHQYQYGNAQDEWAENAGDGTADGRWIR